ncbi:dipeptidyl peptidase 8-like [Hibiscus syriacus]|uniref:Dipeptidyl peptidase 8-like n=1 Tax=Hibiscus syriacus TaxID=106335 RepID=A0A6A2XYN7_HIBSY|nr:dipeptidyl peptidase 8-like [Hibiscus syriacus]
MGAEQALKIILRIKFPQRHSKPPASGSIAENQATNKHAEIVNGLIARSSSDVPAPPINTAVGEKASLLPKRTPASEREFEAILVSKMISCSLRFLLH